MEQFVGSDLVLLTLTVGFYCLGSALYSRTKFALLHPRAARFRGDDPLSETFRYRLRALPPFDRVAQFRTGTFGRGSGLSVYEQLEHMRGRLLPILVSVVVGCVVGVLSVVYLARMLGADRFANFACSEIRDGADRRIGCGTARRHHYDHLGRRLLCRYFRQSRRSWLLRRCGVTDPMAQGFALGLRRMASERPVRSKSVRWKGRSAVWLWH